MDAFDSDEQRSPRRRFLALGAAAATLVLVAGFLVASQSGGDDNAVVDQPDPTTVAATTAPTPTTAPQVNCIELHHAPGLSTFVEVCDDTAGFADGRPRALIDIDARGDDCDGLQAASTRWRDEVRSARESWDGTDMQLFNQREVAAAAAFDTYAVEQAVLKGCAWAEADLADEAGGSYVIFDNG
jgi:hypothetical protein